MKKSLKLVSILIVCAMLLSACGQGSGASSENSDQGEGKTAQVEPITLNLEGGDWGYLTPYTHYSRGPGAYKMKLIFDSMLERGEDGLIPWLPKVGRLMILGLIIPL